MTNFNNNANSKEQTESHNNSSTSNLEENKYERLRGEIFDIKVDYRSCLRSLKIIGLSVAIILTIIAFFGYDKISSIESTIVAKVNERLQLTDSLISTIDIERINELNLKLKTMEVEYEATLSNFEKFISKNEELEEKFLKMLPANERTDYSHKAYIGRGRLDYFEIRSVPSVIGKDEKIDFYLNFEDNFDLNKANVLRITLRQNFGETKYQVKDYYFKAGKYINKLPLTFDVTKGDYNIEIGFMAVEDDHDVFYRHGQNITVK